MTQKSEALGKPFSFPSPSYLLSFRCFEILGFDIMIDSNLNPWLIEVNHLPSFGTDSPLDKDIKDRLMRQVFSVLPVLPDDQAAYAAFHKAESERRLNAHKAAKEKELQALKEKPKSIPKIERKRDSSLERVSPNNSSVKNTSSNDEAENGNDADLPPEIDQQETMNELGTNNEDQPNENDQDPNDGKSLHEDQQDNGNPIEDILDIIDEECTPERLEEIKEILIDIYNKKSPEKINKIDRLLGKYAGHEEEFLLFVFSKYGVSPNEYEKSKPKSIRDAIAARLAAKNNPSKLAAGSQDNRGDLEGTRSPGAATVAAESANKNKSDNNSRNDSKRYSRSLSPPRNGVRRVAPAWKNATPDEDVAFR